MSVVNGRRTLSRIHPSWWMPFFSHLQPVVANSGIQSLTKKKKESSWLTSWSRVMDEDRVAQPVLLQQLFKLANDVEEEGRRRKRSTLLSWFLLWKKKPFRGKEEKFILQRNTAAVLHSYLTTNMMDVNNVNLKRRKISLSFSSLVIQNIPAGRA